jgi:hypothetical protein
MLPHPPSHDSFPSFSSIFICELQAIRKRASLEFPYRDNVARPLPKVPGFAVGSVLSPATGKERKEKKTSRSLHQLEG